VNCQSEIAKLRYFFLFEKYDFSVSKMVEVRFNKPKFSRFSSKSVKRSFSTSSQRRAVQVSVDKRNQYYAAIASKFPILYPISKQY